MYVRSSNGHIQSLHAWKHNSRDSKPCSELQEAYPEILRSLYQRRPLEESVWLNLGKQVIITVSMEGLLLKKQGLLLFLQLTQCKYKKWWVGKMLAKTWDVFFRRINLWEYDKSVILKIVSIKIASFQNMLAFCLVVFGNPNNLFQQRSNKKY